MMTDAQCQAIFREICLYFQDVKAMTGIEVTEVDFLKEIRTRGIFPWYMKNQRIAQREKKLKRILNG